MRSFEISIFCKRFSPATRTFFSLSAIARLIASATLGSFNATSAFKASTRTSGSLSVFNKLCKCVTLSFICNLLIAFTALIRTAESLLLSNWTIVEPALLRASPASRLITPRYLPSTRSSTEGSDHPLRTSIASALIFAGAPSLSE